MIWLVKVVIGFALLWAGWRALRTFRTGIISVFDTDGPVLTIGRQDRPVAFWSFITLFYAALIAIAAGMASL